jgi:hypothetical protein
MNNKTAKNSTNNGNIEYRTNGQFAKAIVTSTATGDRIARISFKTGKKLTLRADRINLQAMGSQDVISALNKTCHITGRIALYSLTTFNGPKGVTRIYSSQNQEGEETGYGLLLKKGKKALSFALSRVDTLAMNAKDIQDAARKAAYTGRIALQTEPKIA